MTVTSNLHLDLTDNIRMVYQKETRVHVLNVEPENHGLGFNLFIRTDEDLYRLQKALNQYIENMEEQNEELAPTIYDEE